MITINGQQIANPASVELGKFKLTKSSRSSSGLMNMDIIATKRKIDLNWDKIAGADLKLILDILDGQVFHQVAYPDPQGAGGQSTITAYAGDITQRAWHQLNGVRYWENVSIGLIER